MRAKKTYTGNKDGVAAGERPGLTELIKHLVYLSEGALWNNGTFVNRPMRGSKNLSVHATGRAVDLSYRKTPTKGRRKGRQYGKHIAEFLVRHSDELGIEMVLDYFPKPHGRGYNWTRGTWQKYTKPTIHGAPGGDWIHVELSPAWADSKQKVRDSFLKIFPQTQIL
jgi:hypothetical protein